MTTERIRSSACTARAIARIAVSPDWKDAAMNFRDRRDADVAMFARV